MRVLVVNAGSSSLKLRVLDDRDQVTGTADLPAPEGTVDPGQLRSALGSLGEADAAGHRIVHGGTFFAEPVLIDDRVLARLRSLTDLAPLHQPKSLSALAAVQAARPDLPAVACFDTAFHASIPDPAATYALPREWRQRWALRRYGFHGLSHSYCSRRAAELAGGG
ncbi:MAG TPA: acetate/propionate family kinase, partial [Streptosporangiaceae bacterium]|nr:acetate/propionate family kinase [Streptosporangiaceae bacterium]